MKKISFLLTSLVFLGAQLFAQVISSIPIFPIANDSITVIFNAAQGNSALEDIDGNIYAHTGVITSLSTGPSDWKYVQGTWGTDDEDVLMTEIGDNLYQIKYHVTYFYSVPETETILELAFVFRNQDGSIVGRNSDGSDIFITVYEPGLNVTLLTPSLSPTIVSIGDEIAITAASLDADEMQLLIDGELVVTTADSILAYTYSVTEGGKKWITVKASFGSDFVADSSYFFALPDPIIAEVPAGMHHGINYINDTTVTLVLYAPFKNYVFAIGDYSNWEVTEQNFMNTAPDGVTFWVTITNLIPNQEYGYQYLIDGTARFADALCEKVLDPNNDPSIADATYPDLMNYPSGKTTGNVSVFQTAQVPYIWLIPDFTPPAKTDLVIYELLVRDFSVKRDYATLIDSLNYLQNLGINAIQLMPIMEFEGNESWGYNPSFFMALDKAYGTPNIFKQFIDAAHEKGIAVILDIAMNHAFGQCPLAQMWWDAELNAPAVNSPYFNQTAKHDYNVGYDFNHESEATKMFRNQVFKYWLREFNIDGYRFDLSKGFTQNNTLGDIGAWGAYDASRIAIWDNIADTIYAQTPDAILILEHFADNSEEDLLSDNDFLLWGNLNYNYGEATAGWGNSSGNSSLFWASYQSRGWTNPGLVTYMESHDEERLMYDNLTFGNASNPEHNAKQLDIALARMETAAAFLFTIPGPKMIWQFGELGYDYSINFGCRVCPKPVKWDYFQENNRKRLYEVYSAIIKLKTQYEVFKTTDFFMDVARADKSINLNGSDMNVTIIGNFLVVDGGVIPDFQHTGWWFDYFSGDSINVTNVAAAITLGPGGYKIYTDVKLPTPIITPFIAGIHDQFLNNNLSVYPNPSSTQFILQFETVSNAQLQIDIINMNGEVVYNQVISNSVGHQKIIWNAQHANGSKVPSGLYLCRLTSGYQMQTVRLVVE